MSQELIDSVISLGKKKKDIEKELGMPQNCLSGMLTGKKPIPLKWRLKLTEYVAKNKSKEETPPVEMKLVDPQPIPEVIITPNSMPITRDMTLAEIKEQFGDEEFEKARLLLQQQSGMYIPTLQPDKYGNQTPEMIELEKLKTGSINELTTFGTVTTKTELVDGKASVKVVDKKKVVNDEDDWKPKLSPFMLARQKAKGGGK